MLKLILGDCLEKMAEIPDDSVDLILADLPYGITACRWDSPIPFDKLWEHYLRLAKPRAAIVLTAVQPFTSALVMSNPKLFRYSWVWDKVNRPTGHLNSHHRPMRQTEDVLVFSKTGRPTYNPQKTQGKPYKAGGGLSSQNYGERKRTASRMTDGLRGPRDLLAIPADERGTVGRLHPTQKPVALMDYLIKTYSNDGETVMDNVMGSGTVGVAAVRLKRSFIGIERDPAYFEIASRRISAETTHTEHTSEVL